ncbi:MAG: ABC transporter permease [Saprospiraceae bacterium]|nr:ABC transporter permease [Saprospiraceae bacterium]
MKRYLFNFYLAIEGINANKLRSFLTALGIIFGVAAVIAMLAIGSGAKQAILEQMKLIGTNNIVLTAKMPGQGDEGAEEQGDDSNAVGNQKEKKPFSPGLTLEDLNALESILPDIESVSPEIVLPTNVIQSAQLQKAKCIGVNNDFFELNQLDLESGEYFHQTQLDGGKPVCIIGKNIQLKFFKDENPIGKQIKCGNTWLRIIGVLQKRQASKESLDNLGIRDYNSDVYIPVTTSLLRFKNRAKMGKSRFARNNRGNNSELENYHQLDRAVIRVGNSRQMKATAAVMARILKRRHNDIIDFEIEVPELLLEQEQKTQDTFNLVLAVIAGISLLVGGIGIMNIMLASVLERIKEIGVRRSLGANRQDIILQFLFEAVIISLLGGVIGVAVGILSAKAIASSADIPTVVSAWSIILSFGVAATIGLIFGLFPARKAAMQDPIKALRSD